MTEPLGGQAIDTVNRRALHVIPRATVGGSWRGVLELAAELERGWGWHTVVCVLGRDEGVSLEGGCTAPVVYLNSPVHERGNFIRRLARLKRLIAEISPSIIHSHLWPAALNAALIRPANDPPHLVHIRDTPLAFSAARGRSRIKTHLIGTILRNRAAMLVAVSRDAADYAIQHLNLKPESVRVVLNGVAPDRIRPVTAGRPTSDRGNYTVGMAGRLIEAKAHAEMIRALAMLSASGRQVRLRIAGAGSQAEALAQLVNACGLAQCVEFMGEVADIRAFYASLDCFVHCSHYEGMPRVLIEAAIAGVPVITVPCAGSRDVFPDSEHGRVLQDPTVNGIASAIDELMRDGRKAAEMAGRARNRALRLFSVERVASDVHELYLEVLEKRRSSERHGRQVA